MNEAGLLLRAYWEGLHELLVENRETLARLIPALLREEIEKRRFVAFDRQKHEAYQDACIAFVEERIEAYNPVGIQYLFSAERRREAGELEFNLDWFNGRHEYERLAARAAAMVWEGMSDEQLRQAATELMSEQGAYPDRSIIAGYEMEPAPGKLPDYVVARAIEQIIS